MARVGSMLGAVLLGVGGVIVVFWVLNRMTELLPSTWQHRVKPYVFVAPALLVVGIYLVFPAFSTALDSFRGPRGRDWVGLENYAYMVTASDVRSLLINNVLWIVMVPTFAVVFGLLVAVLADRLHPRWENVSKSTIFLPMAISFIGAATIWNFVYTFRPAGRPQIGLLNAFWTSLGFSPINWLQVSTFRFNTFLLTVIMIWLQAGFAMVLLSAAIKSVPEETLEAARVDGATEWQTFFKVVVPQIKSTIFVVFTTVTILVMKIFDIVWVLGGPISDTDVVAARFYRELFVTRHWGRAAVLVVVLMVAVIPLMAVNIRRFRSEEAIR